MDDDNPSHRDFPHPAGGRHAVGSAVSAFWRQGIPLKVVESSDPPIGPEDSTVPVVPFPTGTTAVRSTAVSRVRKPSPGR